MWMFLAGLFIGGAVGIITMCFMIAAGRNGDRLDQENSPEQIRDNEIKKQDS